MFEPEIEKNLTVLFYGPRSSCKSLQQAVWTLKIFKYLDKLYSKNPQLPQAIILSNQKFNKEITEKYIEWRLYYWENIRQLRYCPRKNCWKDKLQHRLHDCYIIFDDIATIIPADGWADLPRWFRKTFAQAGHFGIHCLANIQDPISCDINFRRYVDLCYKFRKIIGSMRPELTKPPIKNIWGIYTTRQIPAEELWRYGNMSEEEIKALKEKEKEGIMPRTKNWKWTFHLITRKKTEIYDTLQDIPEYMPNSLEHQELKCINPNCGVIHTRHKPI